MGKITFTWEDRRMNEDRLAEIEDEDTSELRINCPSCRHFVEPNVRMGGDENGFYRWLECPDCYEDITDSEGDC